MDTTACNTVVYRRGAGVACVPASYSPGLASAKRAAARARTTASAADQRNCAAETAECSSARAAGCTPALLNPFCFLAIGNIFPFVTSWRRPEPSAASGRRRRAPGSRSQPGHKLRVRTAVPGVSLTVLDAASLSHSHWGTAAVAPVPRLNPMLAEVDAVAATPTQAAARQADKQSSGRSSSSTVTVKASGSQQKSPARRPPKHDPFAPSAVMLDLFPVGPGAGSRGAGAHFTRVTWPSEAVEPGDSFKRVSMSARDQRINQAAAQPPAVPYEPVRAACFDPVPDHDQATRRARQAASRLRNPISSFDYVQSGYAPDRSSSRSPTRRGGSHSTGGAAAAAAGGTSSPQKRTTPSPREVVRGWRRTSPIPVGQVQPTPGASSCGSQLGFGSSSQSDRSQWIAQQLAGSGGFGGGGTSGAAPLARQFVTGGGGASDGGAGAPAFSGGGGGGGGGGGAPAEQGEQDDDMEPVLRAKAVNTQAAVPTQGGGGTALLIRGGHVVNDDSMFLADVLVEDGLIKQVGANLAAPPGCRVLDAAGKFVMPGGIDTDTHMHDKFMGVQSVDDWASGTRAAVAGGTTLVIDMVRPAVGEPLVVALERHRAAAATGANCDYAFSVLVPQWSNATQSDMAALAKEHGVNNFQFNLAYREQGTQLRDADLFLALSTCKQLGALARVHCENGDIVAEKQKQMLMLGVLGPEGHVQSRPEELEAEAVNRACVLSRHTNCPVAALRVSGKQAADVIAKHKKNGVLVYGEPTAAALGTDGTHYYNACWRHAAGHVTAPPLRPVASHKDHLMDMLASGELHCVSSDHRAHSGDQKALGRDDFSRIPHGVNGVEERLAVVWQRGVHAAKMDPMRFVAVTATNAAKLFNLYPKKGRIAVGADADIVVWDAAAKRFISSKTHHSAADFNIFEGVQCHGAAAATVCAGRLAYDNGVVLDCAGAGRHVHLPTHSPYVYSVVQQREKVCLPQKVDRPSDRSMPAERPIPAKHTSPLGAANVPAVAMQPRGRSQFETSFSLAGNKGDDNAPRAGTKITNPPGGKSSGLW